MIGPRNRSFLNINLEMINDEGLHSLRMLHMQVIFAIPIECLNRPEDKRRYLACNYGHRKVKKIGEYDGLKECMDNHVYKRDKGTIKQIK